MDTMIKISTSLDFPTCKKAVDLALGLGFETINATFPVVSIVAEANVEQLWEQWSTAKYSSPEQPADYINATQAAQQVPPYDWRKKKGLESIFCTGSLLPDNNLDLLPDAINLKIILSPDSAIETVAAACNFAFRLGMETTAYEGSIIAAPGYKGNRIVFTEQPGFGLRLLEEDGAQIIEVSGSGSELIERSAHFLENFPQLQPGLTWSEHLMSLTDSFALRNLDGQLAALQYLSDRQAQKIEALVSEQDEEKLEKIRQAFPDASVENYKKAVLIYEKTYDIPWENDVFLAELEQNVLPLLRPGDQVEIQGVLSEDLESRQALTATVQEKIAAANAEGSVQIVNAYKQGISWIMDFVLPELADLAIDQLKISFNSFLPPGEESWIDESASTPKYTMSTEGGADRWNDLPIRYLQELYPIDDLIEQKTGFSRDKVELALYEGDEKLSYLVQAYDNEGNEIYCKQYRAEFSERPYLDRFPLLGKVHPATGSLTAIINGKVRYQAAIQTDLERIWDIYQQEILEDCFAFVQSKYGDDISIDKQPFFSLLDLDIRVSEPNEQMGIRQDLLSSLDALHEDIYFAGTDFFKHLGLTLGSGALDAPGLILPRIKKCTGKPFLKVQLFDQLAINPSVSAKQTDFTVLPREQVTVSMQSVTWKNRGWQVTLDIDCPRPELLESMASLAANSFLAFTSSLPEIEELVLAGTSGKYSIPLTPGTAKARPRKDINEIDISESELIGYEKYSRIIDDLQSVDGIEVYPIAKSYLGRTLHAIELTAPRKGYTSRVKRLTHLPSFYINARHHANEVSATNGAFLLIKTLLTDPKYRDLSERLNLVIVPMENPDGAEIHYELQKDNPYWSFHVARFNAIGKEFYYEHFNTETIHTEALGLRKLWYAQLPDILADNHGVPTHEWVQQFAGYVYPAFKGFWLPRSLLYGYFWHTTDPEYASNFTVNKKMEEAIADRIDADKEMTALNLELMDRFAKYATQFMPKMFAANYYRNMINYWIPFAYDPTHRYPSIRFPWIVTVSYTAEVADETAQDEYLNLCARTHVAHNLATIDMMLESEHIYEVKKEVTEEKQSVSFIRQRPMLV